MRLERRIEEAVPAGQQLQELGMKLRYDDTSSEQVSIYIFIIRFLNITFKKRSSQIFQR